MNNASIRRGTLTGVLTCFFLSGAAGLIYQVAWGKALGLVFGHTVYAIATVLAAFMGGLALGSACLGRWSERSELGVALYGWLELGVAATGAASLAGISGVNAIYRAVYPYAGGSTVALLGVRLLGAAAVLLLPTFLMGGTLPVLVRALTRRSAELGVRLGRLYWVNTAGAAAGTIVAGFALLPALGLKRTVAVAVTLNLLAGLIALLLGRRANVPAAADEPAVPAAEEAPAQKAGLLLTTFAVVGATAMAYEIGWTRLLATILGSSTYSFTLMLATFLAGIVLGSLLFERWSVRGGVAKLGTFALTQTLTALAALAFLVFFQQLPSVVPPILRATHESFGGLVAAQFVTSAVAMLPAAIVFGFNFPVVTLLIAGGARAAASGRGVGRAYAANTVGAILGAIAAGFWLVPRLGSYRVVALAAGMNLLLAVALQVVSQSPLRVVAATMNVALLAAVAVAGWSAAFYDRALATFGTVLYWNLYEGKLTLAETAATTDIVFATDGLNASISVARTEDYLALRTNGKVDASNHDRVTQLLVGHLGMIFHPAPRRVLVIGFGSGMTVSAIARYPEVERIDCVEIEPAELRAAAYLEQLNRGVLRDPRLHVILDDARNFLLTSRDRYDLIISEPSNPWVAGVATLFTQEYYRAARTRLARGGIFVQWVQAYSLLPEDLRMVLGTFVPEFPQVTLWHGDAPDLLLMAQSEPAPLALRRLRALWLEEALQGDFGLLGMREPEGLAAFFLLDDAELRRLAAGPRRNTDDLTLLEYRAPRALLTRRLEDKNRALLQEYQTGLLPRDFATESREAMLEAAAETMLNLDENEGAERFLTPLARAPTNARLELLRGRNALARRLLGAARTHYDLALRLDHDSLEAAHGLAEVARRDGQAANAELLLRQVLAREPSFLPALETLALIARDRGEWAAAATWQQRRIAADPEAGANEYAQLGEVLTQVGDFTGAEHAFQTALAHDTYSYDAHRGLARLYHERKLTEQARLQLEFLVRYFPDLDASVYSLLAEIYREQGKSAAARAILRKARRIFPENAELRSTAE